MGRIRGRAWVAVVAVGLALVLAGAASASSSTGGANRSHALRAARDVLSAFRVPEGSRSVVAPPPATNPNILVPIPLGVGPFGSPYVVDLHRYFVAPGRADAVVSWIVGHQPAGWGGFTLDGPCHGDAVGHRCLASLSHLGDGAFRGLNVALLVKGITISRDRTAVRVDTDITWWGPKTADDVVPPGAKDLLVYEAWSKPRLARVITNAGTIAKFRKGVNALPVFPQTIACPTDLVEPPVLYAFATSRTAAPFAEVEVNLSGCVSVYVEVHGHPGAMLLGERLRLPGPR